MAWAQEMKNLAADITATREDRADKIEELKEETKKIQAEGRQIVADADAFMKETAADIKAAAKELGEFLAKSEEKRMAHFGALMEDIKKLRENIKEDVSTIKEATKEALAAAQNLIADYKAERKEAAEYWKNIRAKGTAKHRKARQ